MTKQRRTYTGGVAAKRRQDTSFEDELDKLALAETYGAMHTARRYEVASVLIAMIVIGIEEKWFLASSDVGVSGAKYQRFRGSKDNPAAHVLPRMVLLGKQPLPDLPWPLGVRDCFVELFDDCDAPPTKSYAATAVTPAYFNEVDSKLEKSGQVASFQNAVQMAMSFREGNAIAHIEDCMKLLGEGYCVAFQTTLNSLTQARTGKNNSQYNRDILMKIAHEGYIEQKHIAKWYSAREAYGEAKRRLDKRAPKRMNKANATHPRS